MAPELFGPYRLDELIGRGGMGDVYQAFDMVKERTVALKRLPVALAADTGFQARFRRESELAAQLAEPHVIPIHDYGEIDGQLFIDMRLVSGRDLASLLAGHGPMRPAQAVDIVGQVARALDAAHADGLIHRDVKPSNVLISGTAGDEFAYLIDFGISPALAGDGTSITATWATVGTLDYMAPERFGEGLIDARVDVYSLACLLFETLTGSRPFRGDSLPAMIHDHLYRESPRPSIRQPGVPPGLDEVVARGMAKDPEQRYPTAGALATAARTALVAPTMQTAPATQTTEDAYAATTVTTAPNGATAGKGARVAGRAGPRRRRGLVVVGLLIAVGTGTGFLMTVGGSGPDQTATEAVARRVATVPRGTPTIVANILVGDKPIDVVVSPDGRRAYVTNGSGSLSVIDIGAGIVNATIPLSDSPQELAISPDGNRLYVTNNDVDSVSVIDTGSGGVTAKIPVGDRPIAVAVSPDGRRAYVTNGASSSVSVIDTGAAIVNATIPVGGFPRGVAVSPDGRRAYVTDAVSNTVLVIDTDTGTVNATIPVGLGPDGVAVSPDGRRAYVTNADANTLSVIDTAAGAPIATLAMGDDPAGVTVSPDGSRVYSVNELGNTVSAIDTNSNTVTATIIVGNQPDGVAVSPDGNRAYVANFLSDTVSVIDTS